MMPGSDRTRVRVGAVSLELPAALVKAGDAAIDSEASVFKGGGLTVIVDQGAFASRLDADVGRPDYREGVRDVGGRSARTIFFRSPDGRTYTMALHLPAPRQVTVVVHADASVPESVPREILDSLNVLD